MSFGGAFFPRVESHANDSPKSLLTLTHTAIANQAIYGVLQHAPSLWVGKKVPCLEIIKWQRALPFDKQPFSKCRKMCSANALLVSVRIFCETENASEHLSFGFFLIFYLWNNSLSPCTNEKEQLSRHVSFAGRLSAHMCAIDSICISFCFAVPSQHGIACSIAWLTFIFVIWCWLDTRTTMNRSNVSIEED